MIFRLVLISIFYFWLAVARSSRWDSRWVNDDYRNNYNNINNDFLGINTAISNAIRRFFSLRKCKKYVQRHNRVYTVSNSHVSLSFDERRNEVLCYNKKNISQKFRLYDYQLKDAAGKTAVFDVYYHIKDIFNECFDNICSAFDETATYAGIKEFYEKYYNVEEEKEKTVQKIVKEVKQPKTEGIMTVEDYFQNDMKTAAEKERLNVNTANEQQLTDLPGINVVTAKKIIRYRELNNGFKSIEEFYKKMNIKKHFYDKLNGLIFVENISDTAKIQQEDDERIIDF